MSVTHSLTARNTGTNAVTALIGASGKLKFRTAGTIGSPGTAAATLSLSATAFAPSSLGTATANAITSDTNATGNASPVATATLETSGGTIVIHCAVAASGSDMSMTGGLTVNAGDTVSCSSLTYTALAGSSIDSSAIQWNPSDKSTGTVLSNANLTAAAYPTSAGVRCNVSKSSGKWYWEVRIDVGPNSSYPYVGIKTGASSIDTAGPFDDSSNYGVFSRSPNDGHQRYQPGSGVGGAISPILATGDIYMLALDLTNNKLSTGRNGTWDASGNPATNTGGITISAGTWYPWVKNLTDTQVTARFASGAWSYSAPSGFGELTL